MNISLKRFLLTVGVWLCSAISPGLTDAWAQQITKLEYFFNQDPGFGQGTNIALTPGADITKTFQVDISTIPTGFHRLYLRSKDADGRWSMTAVRTFYKEQLTAVAPGTALANVTKGEFFFDQDPGFGMGTNISLSPGQNLTNVSFTADITALQSGFHRLYLRFKDANGRWSMTTVRTFYKEQLTAVAPGTALANVTKGEFFFDQDPGFGHGKNISITPGQDLQNISFAADITALPAGFHRLYLRFKDANGRWSMTTVRTFYKEDMTAGPGTSLPNITKGEFFFDQDPGFGKGTNISLTAGKDLQNVSFAADITALPAGFHRLYVRFKDADGRWSMTTVRSFYKESLTQLAASTLKVIKGEYYVDTDPGFGQGTNIPLTPAPDITNLAFTLDMSKISVGNHKLFVRFQDEYGRWSATSVNDFKVETPLELSVSVGNIMSPLCANGPVAVPFTVSADFGSNNTFTAQLSNATGSFANPVTIGTLAGAGSGTINAVIPTTTPAGSNYRIRVISSSPDKTSEANSIALTINRLPENFSITGMASTCLGAQTYTTSLSSMNASSYTWSVSGGGVLVANGNSATITWANSGIYIVKLTASNDCGSSIEKTMVVSVNAAAPTLTPSVTTSGRWMYASTASAGSAVSNYQWYENGGIISGATTSSYYAYNTAATYTVSYQNACGVGPASNPVSYVGDKQSQTISFSSIPEKTYGNAPFTVQASASSGLGITYSIVSGPATVSGNTVNITGAGAVTVQAAQAGNDQYSAASATQTFTVRKADATVVLSSLTQTYTGVAKVPSVTTSPAGLSVTFTYNGSSTAPINAGTYALGASINSSNYLGSATGTFTIEQASQTITLESVPDKTFGDAAFNILASASSGLPVALSLETNPAGIATLNGNTLTIRGAGSVTVMASQAGNNNYRAATTLTVVFQVNKAPQAISFAVLPNKTLGDAPFSLSASASSGLPVNFEVVSGPATLSGDMLTVTGTGTVTVRATQGGNANFLAATAVNRSFEVVSGAKQNQTISFAALADKTYGDGPFDVTATASSGLPVSFMVVNGPAAVSGNRLTISGAGTVVVRATQSGNSTFNPATAVERSFTVRKATVSIQLANLRQVYDSAAKMVTATTTPEGLTIILTYDWGETAPVNAGSYTVEATIDDDNYEGMATDTLIIEQASQTITAPVLADMTVGGQPQTVQASSSSGLPVTIAVISGQISWNGSQIVAIGPGGGCISFTQPGDNNYLPGTAVQRCLTVRAASDELLAQTIVFPEMEDKAYVDAPFMLDATASSGLPVSYEVVSGPASVSGNRLTLTGVGMVKIKAVQPGNGTYSPATSVERSFMVNRGVQTISFMDIADRTVADSKTFTLQATSSTDLPVSFSIVSGPASVSGNTLRVKGHSIPITVRATQAGNALFEATSVEQTFLVTKMPQEISFMPLSDKVYGEGPFSLTATASSGKKVTFQVTEGPARISGNTLTITGLGTVTVKAMQWGDGYWASAEPVSRSFEVVAANDQTISFAPISNKMYGDGPFELGATASSGLPVSYRILAGPGNIRISGGMVRIVGTGYVEIEASQPGNTSFNAAPSVRRSFTIDKGMQTISFAAIPDQILGAAPIALNAMASSGLGISYTVMEGPARVSGSMLTLTGVGRVTVRATQWGNGNWATAEPAVQSFNVTEGSTMVTTGVNTSILTLKEEKVGGGITAYPNPFADLVSLEFSVKEAGSVKFEVLNLQGEVVKTLFIGKAEAQRMYRYSFDGRNYHNGVYICRLVAKGEVQTTRIVLAR